MWVHAFASAKGPLFSRTAFMRSDVFEVSLSTRTVLFHGNDSSVTLVASHVLTFQSETLLDVDLLPSRSVPDFANLYQHPDSSQVEDMRRQTIFTDKSSRK
jgi:hypothetical protein